MISKPRSARSFKPGIGMIRTPSLTSNGPRVAYFTTDEVDALWECAEANTIPGQFLAFYGIETNANAPNSPVCDVPGQPRCGGHKIGIFGTKPDISCVHIDGTNPEWCPDEGDFYDALDLYSDASNPSIAGAAHPLSLISIPADFWPYSDPDARGGISQAHLDGYEYRSPFHEDTDCVDYSTPTASPPMAGCGYRQMLSHGYQLAPWRGSDNHLNPGARWDNFALGARGICLADAITKPAFRQALRAQRCYWANNGSPRVELEIEGVPMGGLATTDETLDYAIFIDGNGTDVGGGWELGCGEVTQDGGNGGFTFVASGPCDGGSCEVSGSVPAEFWDFCYARVRRSNAFPVVITAAVYLPEPSQNLQLGIGIALLSVLGWRRQRRSLRPPDNGKPAPTRPRTLPA